jgi:hypothetical protein
MQHDAAYATLLDAATIASLIMSVIGIAVSVVGIWTSYHFFRSSQTLSGESKVNEAKTGEILAHIRNEIWNLVLKLVDRLPQGATNGKYGEEFNAAEYETLKRNLQAETQAELKTILQRYGVKDKVEEIAQKVDEVTTKADKKLSEVFEQPTPQMAADLAAFFRARSAVVRARDLLDYLEPRYGHLNAIQSLRRAKSSGLLHYDGALGTDTPLRYMGPPAA